MSAADHPENSRAGRSRIVLRDADAAPAPIVTPLPDLKRTGRYQVAGELARGGMGVVLKGHDTDLGRDVAMKVLREEHAQNDSVLQRFVEEAQIGGQLQHPGIVPVYELGEGEDGLPFFTMKLVKGRTLSALLHERPELTHDRRRFLAIFETICQTIAYAHSRGVIHRDLKPANVMVGAFGEVQVVDWGLAKVLGQGGVVDERRARDPNLSIIATVRSGSVGSQSLAGSVLGTPAYMPPEQAQGQLDRVDERGDVFALGAILCELLTGQPPYVGSGADVFDLASRGELTPAFARLDASGADPELIALAKQCLAPLLEQRPRNAQVVATRIAAYIAELEARGQAALIAAADARARARGLLLVASLLALVVLAGGGFWWQREQTRDRAATGEKSLSAALEEVVALRAKAQAAAAGDAAPWEPAFAAAEGAARLATTVEASDELRARATALRDEIAGARTAAVAEAARTQADRAMVERLAEIRGTEQDPNASTVDDFAAAFRDYGIDVATLAPATAEERVKASRIVVALALALDYWAALEEARGGALADTLRPIARAADPDPWRTRLRDTPRGDALLDLAAGADLATMPEESVIALIYALSNDRSFAPSLDAAVDVATRATLLHPDNFNLQMSLADLHFRYEPPHAEEALRAATIAVALRPDSWNAWRQSGMRYVELQRVPEAARCFERCVELRPRHAISRLNLALTLAALHRDAEAIVHCDAALELQGTSAKVLLAKGMAQQSLGRAAEAIETLEKALKSFVAASGTSALRDQVRARSQLALALLALGRSDEAKAQADQAIALDPGARAAYAFQARGLLLARGGDLAGARTALAQAATLEPGDPSPRLALAAIERRAGELSAAVAALREAVALDPKAAGPRQQLGLRLREAGEIDAALAELTLATRLAPRDPTPRADLGFALRAAGRWRESLESLRRAEELRSAAPAASAALPPLTSAIADGERLLSLEPRLSELLQPAGAPADARGWLDLARLARGRRLHVAAATAYSKAFAAAPRFAEDGAAGDRLDAARSAAQVASGRADDGAALDEAGRALWRSQALRWLADELLVARELIETGSDEELEAAAQRVALLLAERDFAGVRDAAALAALPAAAREEWSAFWSEARELAAAHVGE
ncbi:MAG: protein kinase [Planctomycetes bacterium]|nr:protein kinase [Planctomycetota bacterium]